MSKKKSKFTKILKIIGTIIWMCASVVSLIIIVILISFVILLFYLLPIIVEKPDSTIYDTSCITSDDCILKSYGCGSLSHKCINKEQVEEGKSTISRKSMIPSVNAMFCVSNNVVACKCVQNKCMNINYKKPEVPSDCAKIEESNYRDICYKNSGENLNNSKICFEINSTETKNECFKSLAISQKNHSICYGIENVVEFDECISLVAQVTGNLDLCYMTSSLESCSEIFYREHCGLLGQDIIIDKVDFDTYQLLKIVNYNGQIHKCKEVEIEGVCSPTSCRPIIRGTTDSNGRILVNRTNLKLNIKYKVDDTDAWMSHKSFVLDQYTEKEILVEIFVG
jgi:hypothetical protein